MNENQKEDNGIIAKTYVNDIVSDLKLIVTNFSVLKKEIKNENHINEVITDLKGANEVINDFFKNKSDIENSENKVI